MSIPSPHYDAPDDGNDYFWDVRGWQFLAPGLSGPGYNPRHGNGTYDPNWFEWDGYDTSRGAYDPPNASFEEQTQPVCGIPRVDNAPYVVPRRLNDGRLVNNRYLLDALSYLRSIQNYQDKLRAFYDMYTRPEHPYFIDFKDASGPRVTFTSQATGDIRVVSAYEPFGNWFYGFCGCLWRHRAG